MEIFSEKAAFMIGKERGDVDFASHYLYGELLKLGFDHSAYLNEFW
jgi:hypothetical protein